MIDPADATNTGCTPFNPNPTATNDPRDSRLVLLSGQTLSAIATIIYGANGEDFPDEDVRIDVNLGTSTHNGTLAKVNPDCNAQTTTFPVATTFAGTHRTRVDKTTRPVCVFQSTYTPASFTQNIGPGGPDVGAATRQRTEDEIARQLDLQVAIQANGLLAPSATLDAAFNARFGRCEGNHGPFVPGP